MKKILLKILTYFQELTLMKTHTYEYYVLLSELHFRLYFGYPLKRAFNYENKHYKAFVDRHARMVVTNLCSDSPAKQGNYDYSIKTINYVLEQRYNKA